MPTYANNTNTYITIAEGMTSRTIKPGQTIETEYLLEGYGLTRTEDEPFYNPIISNATVTTSTTITLNPLTKYISFSVGTGTIVQIIFNNATNTPGLVINKDLVLNKSNKIEKLFISFISGSNNSVIITEIKDSLL